MMVPRSYLFSSSPYHTASPVLPSEKPRASSPPNRKNHAPPPPPPCLDGSVSVASVAAEIVHTNPVVIPPKHTSRTLYRDPRATRNARSSSSSSRVSSSGQTPDSNLPPSLATLLETTAIPRRSRSVRNPRKLPQGNHVEAFSRLLMEGFPPREDSASLDASVGSPLDCLLSPPDEESDKSDIASQTGNGRPSSVRSTSSDSMPSLDHDLNSLATSSPATPSSSIHRRTPDRRKQMSPPQDCATDHPLLETELDSLDSRLETLNSTPTPLKRNLSIRSFPRFGPRLGSTFKSNLTASLRAIKSAAQTVSNFATPSVQPDDFLTRSLFSITPELTDDRRPLPMNEPPSPALRRYLNPITLSPAEMYVYSEPRQDVHRKLNSTPASIQMQTYNRAGHTRRGRFSASQSAFLFDPEVPSSRQREPRENSDFLRMVVLEMNMRRRGKLRDDIPTRAKIWLPPRKATRLVPDSESDIYEESAIPQRWIGISIEYTQ